MNQLSYIKAQRACKDQNVKKRVTYVARFFIVLLCSLLVSVTANAAGTSIDSRVQKLERLLDNQSLMQMLQSLQSLQREVSELRGDVEVLSFELDKLKKQQKDIYLDLDQRIQQTDKTISNMKLVAPTAAGFNAVSGGFANGDAETGIDDAQDTLGEQESYQAALTLLKGARYEDAIQSYQVFLINYPESTFAPNAQYWMAEAYYVLKNFQSAVAQFQKVISAYPDSRKVADAHLKLGFAYYELKEWANAQAALEKVITDYSTSTAARLAQRRIQKMKIEGKI